MAADVFNDKALFLPLLEDPTEFREEVESLAVAIHSPLPRKKPQMPRNFPPTPTTADDQEMALMEADIQGLTEACFPSNVTWSKVTL